MSRLSSVFRESPLSAMSPGSVSSAPSPAAAPPSQGARRPRRAGRCAALLLPALFLIQAVPHAASGSGVTTTLTALSDATLIEDPNAVASGSGDRLFAGMNSQSTRRRAMVLFDIAGSVPAGSIIMAASLRLHMSQNAGGADRVDVHRVLDSWGEGGSVASGGSGAPAQPGDATWLYRFFDTLTWMAPGGDIDPVSRAALVVDTVGPYEWTGAPLVDDAQEWLDAPTENHGWVLIGNESAPQTAKRFDAREHTNPSVRPTLTLVFIPPAGSVPDGATIPGPPLTVAPAAGGSVTIDWSASCVTTDTDYAVYEGDLTGDFSNHAPLVCSTGGALTLTVPPTTGSRYYLVVPHNGSVEGSYGTASPGGARGPSPSACLPQRTGLSCH